MPNSYNYNNGLIASSNSDGLFRLSPVVGSSTSLTDTTSISSPSEVVKLTAPPWRTKEEVKEEPINEEKEIPQQETDLDIQPADTAENQPEDMGENLYDIKSNLRNEESSKKSILYKVRKWLANIINPDLPSSG